MRAKGFGLRVGLVLLVSCALILVQQARAQLTLDTPGISTLGSSSTPGNLITVNWEVSTTLNLGVYTYEYQVVNPPTDTTSVDFFNVSFNASSGGNVLTTGGGLFSQSVAGVGVDWLTPEVDAGSSTPALNAAGVLYFTSPLPPTLGNANAQDMNPPSPWASTSPGGQQVPVPEVPEPGTWVLVAIGLLGALTIRRRKA